ncbi:MAG TPA: DNA repair protein RadC [Candidatus Blautia faecipullorum]|nr:DNA repair protein RadC [Candidatus Blautia faecipullorum]
MKNTIKEMPEWERPYEKCIRQGESSLSDSELLAVILRCGARGISSLALANDILSHMKESSYPGLAGILHCSLSDLRRIHGVGTVKAVQLKCIGELSKRIASAAAKPFLSFHRPDSIAAYYMEQLRHQEQELMICMMLDNQNHLLSERLISKGTVNATLVTPREIYLEAVRCHAVSLILVHNHPGGDPAPSMCDRQITDRIFQAGEVLGIRLLDHIIIGDHRYISFKEQGMIGESLD